MTKLLLMGNKYLHPLIYIVADKPAKDNYSPLVPLVGTKSYKVLLNWLGEMNIDITRVRLYNQIDNPFGTQLSLMTLNKAIELEQIKVIALGEKASDYLNSVGVDEYYKLPHPSPRNRLLNQKSFVKNTLGSCHNYVYNGVLHEKV